jgi:hypothetical protein
MTAQTTIEALLFELRDGLGALAEDATRGRLGRCDQDGVRQVTSRLREGKGGPCDPNWSKTDIETLIVEWKKLRGLR